MKITNQEDDVGIIGNYPDTNENEINQYKIVGNMLLYNLETDVLTELANKLLVAMRGLEYRPTPVNPVQPNKDNINPTIPNPL